jgi:hypothetical protein
MFRLHCVSCRDDHALMNTASFVHTRRRTPSRACACAQIQSEQAITETNHWHLMRFWCCQAAWQRKLDRSTGKFFYVHRARRISQWRVPFHCYARSLSVSRRLAQTSCLPLRGQEPEEPWEPEEMDRGARASTGRRVPACDEPTTAPPRVREFNLDPAMTNTLLSICRLLSRRTMFVSCASCFPHSSSSRRWLRLDQR